MSALPGGPSPSPPRRPQRVVEENTRPSELDRPAPRLRSSDNLEAIQAAERAERNERTLLADKQRLEAALEDARQKQLALEADMRRRQQPEPVVNSFPPPVSTRSHSPVSVAPGPDETSFKVRNAKVFGALVVTVLTAVTGLVVGVVNSVRSSPAAPVVVDNSRQVTEQAAQIAELGRNVRRLEKHTEDQAAYLAAVLAETCVAALERPPNGPALPSLQVRFQAKKPAKCPAVRIDSPQPLLSTTPVDNR
jgi:hypothetical protein